MARVFHPLIMLLARAPQAEMAQMVDYLKMERRQRRSDATSGTGRCAIGGKPASTQPALGGKTV